LHFDKKEHPERPERVESIDYHLTVTGLKEKLNIIKVK